MQRVVWQKTGSLAGDKRGYVGFCFVMAELRVDPHYKGSTVKIALTTTFQACDERYCTPGEIGNSLSLPVGKNKKAGLNILSISIDDNKKSWLAAIQADGMPWHHASDLKGWDGPITKKYAVTGVPCIIVLDENNRVVALNIRGDELREKVKELLGK